MNRTLAEAERIAEEVLFPNAVATDRAHVLPRENLDALAEAGLYGMNGSRAFGGSDADFATSCAVVETLASACLTTTFVWCQHLGTLPAVAASPTIANKEEWLKDLCTGRQRTGVILPGHVEAKGVDGGWLLRGRAPWVSGWNRVDFLHVAATTADGKIAWALVEAVESERLTISPLSLLAINASATVAVDLDDVFVPADHVTTVREADSRSGPDAYVLRTQACFPLGIAARCCRLLGKTCLDRELSDCRVAVTRGRPSEVPRIRAAASDLALRASAALMLATGSRSMLLDSHAQRLAREALFLLVFGGRSAVREALLKRLVSGARRVPA